MDYNKPSRISTEVNLYLKVKFLDFQISFQNGGTSGGQQGLPMGPSNAHCCFAFFSLAWGRGDDDLKNFTVIEPAWTTGLQKCAYVKSEHQCKLKLAEPADTAGPPVQLQLKFVPPLSVKCQSLVICY